MSRALTPFPIRSKTFQSTEWPASFARIPLHPRLLLVEPEFDFLADRTLLLTASNYSVTKVSSYDHVLQLHPDARFSLAVLNDTLGQSALRSVALCVRRTWPAARILILRHVESALEDHLYDETIDHPFHPTSLFDVLVKLADDPLDLKPRLFGTSPVADRGLYAPLPPFPSKPLEATRPRRILTTWIQRKHTRATYLEESRAARENTNSLTSTSAG
jgi:hypothetical protein